MWTHRIHQFAGSPRTMYIVRVGIGRVGIPLGTSVFVWLLVTNYSTSFEHLRTLDGWLRLLFFALVCLGEWVLAAGWIVGNLLWLWRASPVVERLRARGFLRRERSAEDGRRVVIALTRAGRAVVDDGPVAPQAAIITALSRLSPSDRRAIARGLTRLVSEMGLGHERAPMLFEDTRTR